MLQTPWKIGIWGGCLVGLFVLLSSFTPLFSDNRIYIPLISFFCLLSLLPSFAQQRLSAGLVVGMVAGVTTGTVFIVLSTILMAVTGWNTQGDFGVALIPLFFVAATFISLPMSVIGWLGGKLHSRLRLS